MNSMFLPVQCTWDAWTFAFTTRYPGFGFFENAPLAHESACPSERKTQSPWLMLPPVVALYTVTTSPGELTLSAFEYASRSVLFG